MYCDQSNHEKTEHMTKFSHLIIAWGCSVANFLLSTITYFNHQQETNHYNIHSPDHGVGVTNVLLSTTMRERRASPMHMAGMHCIASRIFFKKTSSTDLT
jgi:hypothetical protein